MGKEITVRVAHELFSMYEQFNQGIKNFYIMARNNKSVAVIVYNDGSCMSYLIHCDYLHQPVYFSMSEITGEINRTKVNELLDKVGMIKETGKHSLGYDLVIYSVEDQIKELSTCQAGLQKLVDELFQIDGVLKYWE